MQVTKEIVLVSAVITNRLEFIARFISTRMGIGIKLMLADQFAGGSANSGPVILHYGSEPIVGVFNIFSAGLLFETGIRKQETAVFRQQLQTFLYPAPAGFDLPFDLFSASFYLLSRYEEYLPFAPDRHGRFEANQSLAWQQGFLEQPVIDQWIEILKDALRHQYSELHFPVQMFRYISTFDIDSPWAYLHKGTLRNSAGILKTMLKGNLKDFQMRLDVISGKKPDPFDTYAYIKRIETIYNFNSLFFFLFANYNGRDTNYALKTKHFHELVNNVSKERSIGIHPSYKSHSNVNLLRCEYKCYNNILGHKPDTSRQHFLMLGFPETYRQVISMGIREDYTMGYASSAGFRAGTSAPFRFYDLEMERETELVIFPFALMDVTLRQYMSLSPEEALERITHIADDVKKVNGTFTSLWHNESLSEYGVWKGWRQVFEGMVREVRRKE
jgi:hypothetical protein